MIDRDPTKPEDPLKAAIDTFFGPVEYRVPMEYGGRGLVSTSQKDRYGVDPMTGQQLSATDKLWVNDESSPENPANLVNNRMIYFKRGDEREQIFINFNYDTGEFSVTGPAQDLFDGDPREELLAGLRIIAENETGAP